jgi:argininosuccinate lyase
VSDAPGRWHPAYVERVLAPDHRYAARHFRDDFLDALTAHLRCVAELPVAGTPDARAAIAALEAEIAAERDRPAPEPAPGVPDLYFALQGRFAAAAGDDALAWLRLGLSRNDLDMTVYVLAARRRLLGIARALARVQTALLHHADAHLHTIVIARTHHQPAQPSTLAHLLAAAAAVIDRDLQRLEGALARLDRCPLGAAALAGSSHPLDRAASARALGFTAPVANTYDAVASGDWQTEIAALTQTTAVGLSRLIALLIGAAEDGWLRLTDDLTQGSSIMPQKRNPVVLEHARTRASRAAGAAQQLAFLAHNVPFGDLNDTGTDAQEPLHGALDALEASLDLLHAALAGAIWVGAVLAERAAATDTTATELADELVRSGGLPFPRAHALAAALLARLQRSGRALAQATPADLEAVGGPAWDEATLASASSPEAFVTRRSGLGGPAPDAVAAHLRDLRAGLDEYHRAVDARTNRIDLALRTLRAPRKDVPR